MARCVVTLDFKQILENEEVKSGDILDLRHEIWVRNPTFSLESYIAYLDIVKEYAMVCKNDYMLQLGFIPLIMPPSFMGEIVHRDVLPRLPRELPRYPREATSFINPRYRYTYPDIWVSKLDVAKLCGCKIEDATVKEVLYWCLVNG